MGSAEILPKSWIKTDLTNLFKIVGGGTPSTTKSEYWGKGTPWITSADIQGQREITIKRFVTPTGIQESATNEVPGGTLLVATRVGLGKTAIADGPICFSQDLQGLMPRCDLILPTYSLYYLGFALQHLRFEGRGTTISGITKKQLEDVQFPLAPYKEQLRISTQIGELFSELDKGVEALRTARAQLKVYRQAMLKHAFEGKLTADWREENQHKLESTEKLLARIKQEGRSSAPPPTGSNRFANLPPLPEGFVYTPLSCLGEISRGKSKHRPRNAAELFGGPYPFIQTGEIKAADRVIRRHSKTYSERGLAQSKLWPKGTLCITIAANIAETAILGFEGCFPDSVVGFTASKKLVVPEYVELFINSVRARIEAYAPATAQKNINLSTLENLFVPVCSPEEQRVLVDKLETVFSVLENKREAIDNCLVATDTLRQSILKKAFAGQLVRQDPEDEPASVLLDKISAEKE